ncbi:hypothetical protein BST81_24575 [Leptolyngbya sp. 'hensonii']|uniref:hypothetical protein n=1 Tax=Leptolyngbya sp. 'hensonii' TaxID=1922337 RepID=UPI00094FAEA4|nr:hypothetical protein [Leptolyngbya sp. 'hensonii']OLP15792.1 hypothetical protein BST81_24575 [Leptolyngbya sp. 'hensonii']
MSNAASKQMLDFQAIRSITVYQYWRCNACIARYERRQTDSEEFRLLEYNWTPNFRWDLSECTDKEYNHKSRKDFGLSPEDIATREDLIVAGRYFQSFGGGWGQERSNARPDCSGGIVPFLQQFFLSERIF